MDVPFMVQLCGKPEQEITDELAGAIFRNPVTQQWETSDEYLSGNVREKLATAETFAANHAEYQNNVDYLKRVQPKDLDAAEIEVRLGANWVKPEYITQFMKEVFKTPNYYAGIDIKATYSEISGAWNISGKSLDRGNPLVTNTYGTMRVNAYKLLEDALNLRDTKIYDTIHDADGDHRVLNKQETMLAQQAQESIREAFKQWIFKDLDRREDLSATYAGKKLRTANRVKWRKGISTASAAPFGYQFDPNKKGSYIIDPPAAKIVRRIFDLAILGLGTREIAMALNDENAPVPSVYNREHKAYGKETTYTIAPVILWDSSRVWKILTAYVYTGAMVLGKSQRLISGKKIIRIVPKGQQYITEGTHEAIVSREEFKKAQLVIRNNGHRVVMGSVDFPLKGKIRCGNCRRAMGYDYKQASPIFWCREGMELIGQTQCSSEIYQASDIENDTTSKSML